MGPRAGLGDEEYFVPTGISSPDRLDRSKPLYRLIYSDQQLIQISGSCLSVQKCSMCNGSEYPFLLAISPASELLTLNQKKETSTLKVSVDCGILDHSTGGSVFASRATRTRQVMGRYPGTPGCVMGLTLTFSRQKNATLSTPSSTAKV